ncbi:hypothetical protein AB0M39_12405 [Streptomyces sp. NPDC051907]|uniref:hypothetical protein n=1 Tax=Streptomyces sp. NPDC051907 TaxID=3155284 RepID=UPI00341753C6
MTTTTARAAAETAPTAPTTSAARRAAHAIALCAVPSGLWRLVMAAGLPVGYSDEVLREVYGIPGWGIAYVVGLAVLQECAALLPLLLVSERVRLPRPRAVAATAWALSALVTLFCLSQLVLAFFVEPDPNMSAAGHLVVNILYAPLLATGPLLAVVARAYGRRIRA